jgi:hypothetical protein
MNSVAWILVWLITGRLSTRVNILLAASIGTISLISKIRSMHKTKKQEQDSIEHQLEMLIHAHEIEESSCTTPE